MLAAPMCITRAKISKQVYCNQDLNVQICQYFLAAIEISITIVVKNCRKGATVLGSGFITWLNFVAYQYSNAKNGMVLIAL
jgi:hypothetical protein